MVIVDLVLRSKDLQGFYTDAGVLPRTVAILQNPDWSYSFHFINGTTAFQVVLFFIHAVCALLLMFGYRTRIATFFTLILTISLQVRFPHFLQGSDFLLTLLLFWSLFLPLGARFSIDEGLNKTPPQSNHYVSMASAALLIQVMTVYFFSAVMKAYPDWRIDNTAVLYALRGGAYGNFLGQWFGQLETLTRWLTVYVLNLELYGPFVMFVTAYLAPARLVMLFLFITLHVGFLLFLGVGQFPWISITSLLAFTPSTFWDYLGRRVSTPTRLGIKIFYDAPCDFCKKISLILRSFLLFPEIPVLPAQDSPKIRSILEKHNSWVVLDNTGKTHVRWDAMLMLIRRSPIFGWLAPVLSLPTMRKLGERFYSWVATNRERLAHKTAPWLVTREVRIQSSWVTSDTVLVLLVIMLLANITYVHNQPMPPPALDKVLRSLNLYQPWTMFIQNISQRVWYVARGVTKDGQVVDVYRNRKEPPSLSPPKHTSEGGWDPNYRWRKFVLSLRYPALHKLRPYYAAYLCREWNNTHQGTDQLDRITIVHSVGGGVFNHPTKQYPWPEYDCDG
jgi:predicted DCC family thiol-disulfide oxidoreductase YuxK